MLPQCTRLYQLLLLTFSISTLTSAQASPLTKPSPSPLLDKCSNNPTGPLTPLPSYKTCSLLIDDDDITLLTRQSKSHSPWTYPPQCATPQIKPRRGKPTKLCTFSVSSLRGSSRAFSIITAPEVAAHLAPTLQDPNFAWLGHRRGGSPFSLPWQSLTDKTGNVPPYEIKPLPGKGLGAIATRPIQRDEVLMIEYPVILQTMQTYGGGGGWDVRDLGKLLQVAAHQLGERGQEELLGMARKGKGYVVDDVLRTNSFQVTVNGVDHLGLYPRVSRINHECRPNCVSRYSPSTLAMDVVAYRDIKEGEELTFSYLPLNLPRETRQEMIRGWGFNCTCSLCSASAAEVETSDRQRLRIQDVLASFDDPVNHTHDKVHRALDEVLELVGREGMEAQIGDFYGIIARIYRDMGDLERAVEYARMAVKEIRHYAGFDNERTVDAERFWDEVEGQFRRK